MKRFGFMLRSDSTEPRNASRVLNLVLQLLAVQDQGITGLFDRKFLRESGEIFGKMSGKQEMIAVQ